MEPALNTILIVLLVTTAILATLSRDLLAGVIIFSVYGLIMSLMWLRLQAPDLALAEAAMGAGVTTVFFLVTVFKTRGRDQS
jgi:energy-converting hydrogenase B subunit D